jgi:hypothetical protein
MSMEGFRESASPIPGILFHAPPKRDVKGIDFKMKSEVTALL